MDKIFNKEARRQRRIRALERLTGRVVLSVLALSLAACATITPEEGYIRLQAALEEHATKGAPATTPGASFKAWAYVYPSGGGLTSPNYLCGETFSQSGSSTTYVSAGKHGDIQSGYTIRWWALSPASPSGVSGLPLASSSGSAAFSYTTPAAVTSQDDLLIAATTQAGGSGSGPSLTFSHALSCMQFRTSATAADVPACTIVSITITGVKNSATWTDGSGWSTPSGSTNITVSPGTAITSGQTDTQMHTDAQSMMLLPQAFTSGNKIQVTVNTGGSNITKEASLSGITLVQGQKCILHLGLKLAEELTLSCESINWIE